MGILYDANNVKVGVATTWICPWLQPTPTVQPLDTVTGFGTLWAAPWVQLGATDEGWKIGAQRNRQNITIEEQQIPVDSKTTDLALLIQAALAEDTMQTMQLAFGGGTIVVTAPATGIPGNSKMFLSSLDLFYTVGMETLNKQGFARRYYIPKCTIGGSGDTEFRRAAGARLYPLQITAVCDPTEIKITEITAAALP